MVVGEVSMVVGGSEYGGRGEVSMVVGGGEHGGRGR